MDTALKRILDSARWAPSGDNTQPWRFEVLSSDRFVIRGHDTRDWCVYDLEGHASQLAIGALLENISIAASGEGRVAEFSVREDAPETAPEIEVRLVTDQTGRAEAEALLPFLERRVTQRRALKTNPLQPVHRDELEASVGADNKVLWVDGARQKREMAKLLFFNANIRLTIREAFEVHRRIIEWDADYSEDRIPDRAVGLDPINLKAMRWAMGSWGRVSFLNRFLSGTFLPRLTLDYIPGIKCAAHFFIVGPKEPTAFSDFLGGGRAMQRFWLTATKLGLQFQPEMTPLIFSRYVKDGLSFTKQQKALHDATRLRSRLAAIVGEETLVKTVFMGRVGYGPAPTSRSIRLPLSALVSEPAVVSSEDPLT